MSNGEDLPACAMAHHARHLLRWATIWRRGIAIGRRMLRRPGQWPLAMAAPPAPGLDNGRSLPLRRPAQRPLCRSPYFRPRSVPVNERVHLIAAPSNGIDRTLPSIVGGILTS